MDDLISRAAAIDLAEEVETKRLKGEIDLTYAPMVKGLTHLPSAQPESVGKLVGRQAVMALDMFTKLFCQDYTVSDNLVFRCDQCEFEAQDQKCLVKVMARKICPDYKDFGCMGDL